MRGMRRMRGIGGISGNGNIVEFAKVEYSKR